MNNIKVVNRKQLSNKTKYNFCPYCVKRCKQTGKDFYNELSPLWHITTVEQIQNEDGTFKDYFDDHYECINCHKRDITTNDFLNMYCARSDGTKYTEKPKDTQIWNRDKGCFVPAEWNVVTERFEEVSN